MGEAGRVLVSGGESGKFDKLTLASKLMRNKADNLGHKVVKSKNGKFNTELLSALSFRFQNSLLLAAILRGIRI